MAAVARAAEDAGVTNLSLMDHYFQLEMMGAAEQPMLEGYTSLGFLAALTSTVELQLLVTGVTYRHPGLLAKIVSTLDVLSGGRAVLGIGAAWYEREHRGLGVPVSPAGRAVRAPRGDAADRPPDVERGRRPVRRARTTSSPRRSTRPQPLRDRTADPDRRRRREEDAAAGREVRRRAATCSPGRTRRTDDVAGKLDVLREHCAREGTDYDRIDKTVLYAAPLARRAPTRPRRSPRRWPPTPPSASPRCTSCRCTATRSGSSATSASTSSPGGRHLSRPDRAG